MPTPAADAVDTLDLDRALEKLGEVRTVEVTRAEAGELGGLALEALDHLRRTDADGERRGEHGTGREPDVGIELVGLAVDEEVVQGLQAAELEGTARYGTPGEHKRRLASEANPN